MSNTGDSEYRTLLKFLASVKGDSWVVDTALPAFLTPLELRLHDVLVDGYGFHPDQLIWKTPAKTFVSDKARFGRFDRRTLNSELVLLGILDEKTEGVVKHIVLKPGASSDMERLLRHERLPYSKLPDSLNADSADADLRRALFGIVGRHPRFLWNSRLPTPEEVAARAVVSKELTGQAFLDYFEDFTLMLAQEIHDDETRPHKSEDDGYSAEGIAKAKDRIREQNPVLSLSPNPRHSNHPLLSVSKATRCFALCKKMSSIFSSPRKTPSRALSFSALGQKRPKSPANIDQRLLMPCSTAPNSPVFTYPLPTPIAIARLKLSPSACSPVCFLNFTVENCCLRKRKRGDWRIESLMTGAKSNGKIGWKLIFGPIIS